MTCFSFAELEKSRAHCKVGRRSAIAENPGAAILSEIPRGMRDYVFVPELLGPRFRCVLVANDGGTA